MSTYAITDTQLQYDDYVTIHNSAKVDCFLLKIHCTIIGVSLNEPTLIMTTAHA